VGFCHNRAPESNSDKIMLDKIFKKIRKKLAIRELSRGYSKRLELELLMEDWITKRILDGKTERRDELIKKQAEIQELKLFIDYLKTL